LLNLHYVGEGRVTRLKPQQQKVAEPDHGGQQIIEVMRDPACELANGLHLLRLGELDLEVLLLSDVNKLKGQPSRIEHGGGYVALGIVKAAEEQDNRLFLWASNP
jgi:hypothetical protein